MIFSPRPMQVPMIQHAIKYPFCALWAEMGAGKTSAILYLVLLWKAIGEHLPALVIAPKKVARETWIEQRDLFEEFRSISISVIIGTDAERRQALKVEADIYCINYENLPWLVANRPERFEIKTFIADEATRLKSFRIKKGSKRAKSLFLLSTKAERFIELTGTPGANGLIDLWGQLYFLDRGQRLGKTFGAFKDRWFNSINCGYFTEITPRESAAKEIPEAVKDICVAVRTEDYYDIGKPIENNIFVTLPESVMDVYKPLEKELYTKIKGKEILAANMAVATNKCLQMASGGVYYEGEDTTKSWFETHDEKLVALESIIEEAAGKPIIVVYHFRCDIVRIQKRFPSAVLFKDKPGIAERWNKGEIPILLLHPASAGHGLNLQYGGNIIVFFTSWWSFEEREQAIARIGPLRQLQAGLNRSVYVYNIIARNTVDERVIMAQKYKMSVDEALKTETVRL